MRNERKIMKHNSLTSGINIKLVVKIGLVALGCYIWGTGFIWALVGLYLALSILRAILSCLVGLAVIIAFILILLTLL